MAVFCTGNLGSDSFCKYFCTAGTGQDDQKFLAAPAAHQILFSDHGLEQAGGFGQNSVTGDMPPAVIHMFEIIDID